MRHTATLLSVLALCPIAAVRPGTARTVAEWGQAAQSPALQGAGLDAAGRTVTLGHLRLELASGRLVPVRVADRVVGAWFEGQGRWRYLSSDPIEAATWRENVRRGSKYKVDADGGIGDAFERALVWLPGGLGPLGGEGWDKAGEGDPPAALSQSLARHLERRKEDRIWRHLELVPQALVEPPPTPLAVSEIDAREHDLVHTLDPMRDHDESLAVMRKSEVDLDFIRDWRFADFLSVQPLGRDRLSSRPDRFKLVDLDLTLVNPAGRRMELETTETFQALRPVQVLDLLLPTRVYGPTAYRGALGEAVQTVESVTGADGQALAFSHLRDDLLVELPRRLGAGEKVTLKFRVTGDVLFRPGEDNHWERLGPWYPRPQRLAQEAYAYHAILKTPRPFVPFTAGKTLRRWEEGEMNCAEFREEHPSQYVAVLAGKYTTLSEEKDGFTVRVSSYGIPKEHAKKQIAALARSLVEMYRPLLGAYPFAELNVLEIDDYGFGVAPPGLIFITREAFLPLNPDSSPWIRGVNQRLAHEVAHGWWGHVAKLGDDEDQWLSESVAEYYSAYIMQARGKEEFDKAMARWKRYAGESRERGSVYLANRLAGDRTGEHRVGLLYNKGPVMLHSLRQELGDQAFFTVLKSFLRSFPNQPARTRDFIDLTSFVAKKDMKPFFDRYLFGLELPGK